MNTYGMDFEIEFTATTDSEAENFGRWLAEQVFEKEEVISVTASHPERENLFLTKEDQ